MVAVAGSEGDNQEASHEETGYGMLNSYFHNYPKDVSKRTYPYFHRAE
jgi:hypothetical protein